MKITIEVIPHDKQRYPTAGDWQWDAYGNLKITVSNMNNWRYEFLVAFHELMEVMLCRSRGITQEQVDGFDIRYEQDREEGDTSEPGDDPNAPYSKEHFFATSMEKLLADELRLDWEKYDETVANL